jgi:hypothetical protein
MYEARLLGRVDLAGVHCERNVSRGWWQRPSFAAGLNARDAECFRQRNISAVGIEQLDVIGCYEGRLRDLRRKIVACGLSL